MIVDIWKSYICTAVKKWIWKILLAINTTELVVEIRPEKNSGLYGIWTYDLCNTRAVLYQLS